MKYFKNVETLEDLKKEYKRLALIHHPDCGGSDEAMKAVNNEYDELFPKLKNKHKNAEGTAYEKETEETSDYWKDIISSLLALQMVGVIIEVVGSFLWVSGNTVPYKDQLGKNGLGLKWAFKKKAWYLSPPGYKRFNKKKDYDLDEIREMYGSEG